MNWIGVTHGFDLLIYALTYGIIRGLVKPRACQRWQIILLSRAIVKQFAPLFRPFKAYQFNVDDWQLLHKECGNCFLFQRGPVGNLSKRRVCLRIKWRSLRSSGEKPRMAPEGRKKGGGHVKMMHVVIWMKWIKQKKYIKYKKHNIKAWHVLARMLRICATRRKTHF